MIIIWAIFIIAAACAVISVFALILILILTRHYICLRSDTQSESKRPPRPRSFVREFDSSL